jgi:hypothetical protein
MIELFILWNIAAARADQSEDTDMTTGVIVVWAFLQLFIWPVSMFLLLWKKVGLRWDRALIVSGIVMTWGLWLGGENFFFGMGIIAVIAAFSLIAKEVVSDS